MQVLRCAGPVTAADVRLQLGDDLAYTTVATMLRKMETRGLARHDERGRKFVYEAAVDVDAIAQGMTRDLVDRVIAGSLPATVSHLLDSREISREELDRLEHLIKSHRQEG
jgi:predicted transcriptional regulator